MKKISIIILCIIAIISGVAYGFANYKAKQGERNINNSIYANLYEKDINGNDLATIINKTLDNNEKNNIEKDENGIYKDNNKNSIKIEIKFKQSDNIISIEKIYNSKISRFIELYGQVMFKCTKIEYHTKTKLGKYLYFEEI